MPEARRLGALLTRLEAQLLDDAGADDPGPALGDLAQLLSSSRHAVALLPAFSEGRGYQLALGCLSDPPHAAAAGRLLLASAAAAAGEVQPPDARDTAQPGWPPFLPARLAALALDPQQAPVCRSVALQVLARGWAVGGAAQQPPLQQLGRLLGLGADRGWLQAADPGSVAALALLAARWGGGQPLPRPPLALLLDLLAATHPAQQQPSPGGARSSPAQPLLPPVLLDVPPAGCGGPGAGAQQPMEPCCAAAWVVLGAAEEAVGLGPAGWQQAAAAGSSTQGAGAAGAAAFPPSIAKALVAQLEALTAACPRHTSAALAWDGSTTGYEQRPAASAACPAAQGRPAGAAARVIIPAGPGSLLEGHLRLLGQLLGSCGRSAAKALWMAGLGEALQPLAGFSTAPVLLLTERLHAALAAGCKGYREEVLGSTIATASRSSGGGGGVGAPALLALVPLVGLACHAPDLPNRTAALGRLCGALDACGGRDFAHCLGATHRAVSGEGAGCAAAPGQHTLAACLLGQVHGALCSLLGLLQTLSGPAQAAGPAAGASSSPLPPSAAQHAGQLAALVAAAPPAQRAAAYGACRDLLLCCLDRSRRMGRLGAAQLPRGHLWGVVHLRDLEDRLRAAPQLPAAADSMGPARVSAAAGQPCAAAASVAAAPGKRRAGRCNGDVAAPAAAVPASAAQEDDHDEDGLRVVWDSAPAPGVRAQRAAWSAMPLRDRLDWGQTSTDVEVSLTLPPGTRKADVGVVVAPERLTVRLGWAGRVLDGRLAHRVKAADAVWWLEEEGCGGSERQLPPPAKGAGACTPAAAAAAAAGGGAVQLRLVLPKDSARGHYWRALFEGGEQRSHWEVLKEAVSCEEDSPLPSSGGEALPGGIDPATYLEEELRERMALATSGDWCLRTGFDDFRVVLGDGAMR